MKSVLNWPAMTEEKKVRGTAAQEDGKSAMCMGKLGHGM